MLRHAGGLGQLEVDVGHRQVLRLALQQELGADLHDPVHEDGALPVLYLGVARQAEVVQQAVRLALAIAHGVECVLADAECLAARPGDVLSVLGGRVLVLGEVRDATPARGDRLPVLGDDLWLLRVRKGRELP